ncbi:hypothetical protein RYX36_031241 [Vicia faba]
MQRALSTGHNLHYGYDQKRQPKQPIRLGRLIIVKIWAFAFPILKYVYIFIQLSRNIQDCYLHFQCQRIIRVSVCLICLFLFFSRFIDIDIDKAMQRVLKRHISTGIYGAVFL